MKPYLHRILVLRRQTPVGTLLLGDYEGRLCLCDWEHGAKRDTNDRRLRRLLCATVEEGTSPLLERATQQLTEYFEARRTAFDLPLHLVGTPFQIDVWEALRTIPYGATCAYRDVAMRVGHPAAYQAVAAAIASNPLSIIVPCHRVVASDGSLHGYAGGLPAKAALLSLERPLFGAI